MIEKFTISRDDSIYEAFPDVTLAPSGRLVCVFSECTHHGRRDYSRVMMTTSQDHGRTWTPKQPVSEALRGDPERVPYWNCARISTLSDGRLVVVSDRICGRKEGADGGERSNWLWFSEDEGDSWEGPHATPICGIVPDQVAELKHGPHAGRWLLATHGRLGPEAEIPYHRYQECWLSDDQGESWQGPVVVADDPQYEFCEGNILELPDGALVCFIRENSGRGLGCFRTVSRDAGESWQDLVELPIPGCHRPTAGILQSGNVLITHRYYQGGKGGWGNPAQNLFAALTDVESCLAKQRTEAKVRILPLDFDRSPEADIGYSAWVQFPDGEIYVVSYLLDDAPKAQIRGYALTERDFLIEPSRSLGDATMARSLKGRLGGPHTSRRRLCARNPSRF